MSTPPSFRRAPPSSTIVRFTAPVAESTPCPGRRKILFQILGTVLYFSIKTLFKSRGRVGGMAHCAGAVQDRHSCLSARQMRVIIKSDRNVCPTFFPPRFAIARFDAPVAESTPCPGRREILFQILGTGFCFSVESLFQSPVPSPQSLSQKPAELFEGGVGDREATVACA
jgi:hypothetical protein